MATHQQRVHPDRRRKPTPPLSRYALWGGRRRSRRRSTDSPHFYVDRIGGFTWLAILSVFLLQVLDAYLTIGHLHGGAIELNPLMNALIQHGETLFIIVKLGVSAAGLWFLGIHKNFPLVRPGLALLFAMFLAVVGWHFFLAFQVS